MVARAKIPLATALIAVEGGESPPAPSAIPASHTIACPAMTKPHARMVQAAIGSPNRVSHVARAASWVRGSEIQIIRFAIASAHAATDVMRVGRSFSLAPTAASASATPAQPIVIAAPLKAIGTASRSRIADWTRKPYASALTRDSCRFCRRSNMPLRSVAAERLRTQMPRTASAASRKIHNSAAVSDTDTITLKATPAGV